MYGDLLEALVFDVLRIHVASPVPSILSLHQDRESRRGHREPHSEARQRAAVIP
jgi:hypothetical protein